MSATATAKKKGAKGLARMVKILSTKRYFTARQLASRMGCSIVVTYKRINQLRNLRCKFEEVEVQRPAGWKGPSPVGLRLVENRASKKILTEAAELS